VTRTSTKREKDHIGKKDRIEIIRHMTSEVTRLRGNHVERRNRRRRTHNTPRSAWGGRRGEERGRTRVGSYVGRGKPTRSGKDQGLGAFTDQLLWPGLSSKAASTRECGRTGKKGRIQKNQGEKTGKKREGIERGEAWQRTHPESMGTHDRAYSRKLCMPMQGYTWPVRERRGREKGGGRAEKERGKCGLLSAWEAWSCINCAGNHETLQPKTVQGLSGFTASDQRTVVQMGGGSQGAREGKTAPYPLRSTTRGNQTPSHPAMITGREGSAGGGEDRKPQNRKEQKHLEKQRCKDIPDMPHRPSASAGRRRTDAGRGLGDKYPVWASQEEKQRNADSGY